VEVLGRWRAGGKECNRFVIGVVFSANGSQHYQMNIIITSSILLAPVLLLGAVTAAEIDLSKLPPPSKQKGVTYAKDIQPVLKANCFRCHGDEKAKAALRLDSLEAALKGSKEGKVIVPGKSEKSLLVIAVAQLDPEKSMPPKPRGGHRGRPGGGPGGPPPGGPGPGPKSEPLTAEQVGLVRAWIDQGAK
jgi:hypothetical protein